jgi:hypothetical protein
LPARALAAARASAAAAAATTTMTIWKIKKEINELMIKE